MTTFNLVGIFQRDTSVFQGKDKPRRVWSSEEKHILKKDMTVEAASDKESIEGYVDRLALSHTKRTKYERVWLIDWELQENNSRKEAV